MLLAGMLTIVSCKKDGSEESFGKPETTNAQKPEELGAEIFAGKGACIACHKPDVKLVGPSLQDIAKIYKEKNIGQKYVRFYNIKIIQTFILN